MEGAGSRASTSHSYVVTLSDACATTPQLQEGLDGSQSSAFVLFVHTPHSLLTLGLKFKAILIVFSSKMCGDVWRRRCGSGTSCPPTKESQFSLYDYSSHSGSFEAGLHGQGGQSYSYQSQKGESF